MSTTSSRSTTPTVTMSATRCSSSSARACRRWAAAASPTATAARSSAWSFPPATSARRCRSSRRCAARSSATGWRSAARTARRRPSRAAARNAPRDLPRAGRDEAVRLRGNALVSPRRAGGGTRFFLNIVFLIAIAISLPVFAVEKILDFHSSIRIDKDGALNVTERIEAQVEGKQIRSGILREFPSGDGGAIGVNVRVPFRVIAVKRDGQSEHYAVERLAKRQRIRIGNADVMLSPGRHVYEITYRTSRQLGFFSDHDELYWNVSGSGWPFPFDRLSAEVRLPAPVPAGALRLAAYTGPQGSRGTSYAVFARDGGAAFRATRALGPREGMTIVVGFPKGVVTQPSLAARAGWWLSANAGAAAALLGCGLLL